MATERTDPTYPPTKQSDEADKKGLELAQNQGDALEKALKYMIDEIAEDGREIRAGEYRVGYAVEEAEGMYEMVDGSLQWREPDQENVHVEVSVRDGSDGRFIPGLEIEATLIGPDGSEVGTRKLPFLWHPYLYHYGRNWVVPGDGDYKMKVTIAPPTFSRHDKKNGKRYAEPVEVVFENVSIKTGQG